jgi:hypothetical protein
MLLQGQDHYPGPGRVKTEDEGAASAPSPDPDFLACFFEHPQKTQGGLGLASKASRAQDCF